MEIGFGQWSRLRGAAAQLSSCLVTRCRHAQNPRTPVPRAPPDPPSAVSPGHGSASRSSYKSTCGDSPGAPSAYPRRCAPLDPRARHEIAAPAPRGACQVAATGSRRNVRRAWQSVQEQARPSVSRLASAAGASGKAIRARRWSRAASRSGWIPAYVDSLKVGGRPRRAGITISSSCHASPCARTSPPQSRRRIGGANEIRCPDDLDDPAHAFLRRRTLPCGHGGQPRDHGH